MKKFGIVMLVVLALGAFVVVGGLFSTCSWFAGGVIEEAKKELAPAAIKNKYEWFKSTHAVLNKKLADITLLEGNLQALYDEYEGTAKKDWDRQDKVQLRVWKQEYFGVLSSYNDLAAQYNTQMSIFYKKFANFGDMPVGDQGIPKEVAPYKNKWGSSGVTSQ